MRKNLEITPVSVVFESGRNPKRTRCGRFALVTRTKHVSAPFAGTPGTTVTVVSRLFSGFRPNLFKFYGVISLMNDKMN